MRTVCEILPFVKDSSSSGAPASGPGFLACSCAGVGRSLWGVWSLEYTRAPPRHSSAALSAHDPMAPAGPKMAAPEARARRACRSFPPHRQGRPDPAASRRTFGVLPARGGHGEAGEGAAEQSMWGCHGDGKARGGCAASISGETGRGTGGKGGLPTVKSLRRGRDHSCGRLRGGG